MSNPESLIVWVVGLPLLAAVVTAALGPWLLGRWSHLPTVLGLSGALVCSLVLLNHVLSEPAPNAAHEEAAGESDSESEATGDGEIDHSASGTEYELLIPLWTWADLSQAGDPASLDPETLEPVASDSGISPPSQPFNIEITLRLDGLTVMMLSMVSFISLFVAIFSIGYMHGDRGYWRFFSYLPLFVFSMTMLVSVSNYLLLFVFWEGVGVCSYLLIGFWYTKPEAAAAAKKAFLVNRVGDFGLALGIFLIWITFHTLDFHDSATGLGVFSQLAGEGLAGYAGSTLALVICLLLLVGACGKSAQFPLHVWLPDAMEGPTPASALIHAATMVTAGVYLVARSTPLFIASPDAQLVVALIGGLTAFIAAVIALTQFDLKRVLAYSTISQLGYMFMGLGAGTLAGVSAGMFHLFTHAFFKALLFMGAGSVMHAMGNVIDMRRFGGLRKIMPITHATFLVGCLALAGLAPLAGFWSKDAIIGSLHDRVHDYQHLAGGEAPETHDDHSADSHDTHAAHAVSVPGLEITEAMAGRQVWGLSLVYWSALITAVLTAFYTFRAFFMTFYGEELVPAEAGDHAHESPPVMWVPLAVLSLGVVIISGACLLAWSIPDWLGGFTQLLGRSPSLAAMAAVAGEPTFHWSVALLSTGGVLLGISLAAYLYLGHHKEISTVRDVLDFRWLRPGMASQVTAWVAGLPLTAALGRGMGKVGLGWLADLARLLLLVVLMIVLTPLWLGYIVSPYRLSEHKFYFDEIYDWAVVKPVRGFGRICASFDRLFIDGLVDFIGRRPAWLGKWLRELQVGLLSFYALAMLLGVLALIVVRAWWS